MRTLFERYPKVRDRVTFEPMVNLPTPVTEHRGVWVKRDDRIGGGVLRKLEFFKPEGKLLAWGTEGSNWLRALARHRGARVLAWRRGRDRDGLVFGLRMLAEMPRLLGGSVTLAPLGGTDPVTTLGFVNAALELAGQVARGECPRPDAIFVPLGTGGTAAGLALGLALAGMETTLQAVRIAPSLFSNLRRVYGLASQAAFLLDERPRLCRLVLERGFRGVPASEGRAAQDFFRPLDLDAGAAAKAAACLLARRSAYRTPLLWLTYGSMDAATAAPVP